MVKITSKSLFLESVIFLAPNTRQSPPKKTRETYGSQLGTERNLKAFEYYPRKAKILQSFLKRQGVSASLDSGYMKIVRYLMEFVDFLPMPSATFSALSSIVYRYWTPVKHFQPFSLESKTSAKNPGKHLLIYSLRHSPIIFFRSLSSRHQPTKANIQFFFLTAVSRAFLSNAQKAAEGSSEETARL